MATQFVIMFNDVPEEVCPPGMTGEQADARAKEIKEEYVALCKRNNPSYTDSMCYVRAREVRVTPPTLHIKG